MKNRYKVWESKNPRTKIEKCSTCKKYGLLYRCVDKNGFKYVCKKCITDISRINTVI